jgi:hypothetical protein
MTSAKISRYAILLPALILCLAGTVWAGPAGLGDLDVALYQGDVLLDETATNDSGTFLLEGVAAGSYRVVVTDPGGAFLLDFLIEVEEGEAPAAIAGQLFGCAYADFSLNALARVVGPEGSDGLDSDRAAISPRRWAPQFEKSLGKVKVRVWGTGLDLIETVTLQNETGEVSTADIRLIPLKGRAVATFFRAAAYEELVPEGAGVGEAVPVEIVIGWDGDDQVYSKQILVVGRNKQNQ